MICCLLIPYFVAALERRNNPALEGPLLVVDGTQSQVYATCRVAAQLGVQPGMSLRQAQALCPQACIIPANRPYYRQVRQQVVTVLTAFSDRVEVGQVQQALACWLDLGELSSSAMKELIPEIGRAFREEIGLSPAIGGAGGKFPAWVAALTTDPNKALFIPAGGVARFLAPYSVKLLPLDAAIAEQFDLLGLRTLGQVAAIPCRAMASQFGRSGRLWHQLACGQDPRPVVAYQPQAQEALHHQFEPAVADQTVLSAVLGHLAQTLAERLQGLGRLCREIRLSVHLEDGNVVAEGLPIPGLSPNEFANRIWLM